MDGCTAHGRIIPSSSKIVTCTARCCSDCLDLSTLSAREHPAPRPSGCAMGGPRRVGRGAETDERRHSRQRTHASGEMVNRSLLPTVVLCLHACDRSSARARGGVSSVLSVLTVFAFGVFFKGFGAKNETYVFKQRVRRLRTPTGKKNSPSPSTCENPPLPASSSHRLSHRLVHLPRRRN